MAAPMRARLPLLLLLCLASAAPARADEDPADWTYQAVSPQGRARLVQRCEGPADCQTAAYAGKKLLWKVPRALARRGGTTIADDGRHVVHASELVPFADPGEAEAVAFYDRGVLVKRWRVKELVDKPEALPKQSTDFRALVAQWRFAGRGRRYELKLTNGEWLRFDVATGEQVAK